MTVKYNFNEKKQFIVEDYDEAKTFASFLPGIAGMDGIPMWCFYVNRGQCMGSFGVKDKDNSIMEFFPANTMYKNIEIQGFRTFIKHEGSVHEIFSSVSKDSYTRKMIIEKNILTIEEINKTLKIKVTVKYFIMPRENYAAMVRRVIIDNLENVQKDIEILDGMTQLLPFGVSNSDYQAMSNLNRAWFDVYNIENDIPYYKLRSTTQDSAKVGSINGGNFFAAFSSDSDDLLKPIYDMNVIFGDNTSLLYPKAWNSSVSELLNRKQTAQNKTSGGFAAASTKLNKSFQLCEIIGYAESQDSVNVLKKEFNISYIESKEKEARDLTEKLVKKIETKTSKEIFDEYAGQCFLDNVLRGGFPILLGEGDNKKAYHVYSRKHGDLEREYNFFSVEPAYYSQGNGNFRDVNQNRRNDVFFEPQIKDFNVKQFMSLIQMDGYNPLSVKGCTFIYKGGEDVFKFVLKGKEKIQELLKYGFTPGGIMMALERNKCQLSISKHEFLNKIIAASKQNYEAEFGEGYWCDHWTYNMDLIESYLDIYPERLYDFAFDDFSYKTFDSVIRVLPRQKRYVLEEGKVRQYCAIELDKEKSDKFSIDIKTTNWLRIDYGSGEIYKTNLYSKLIILALNKFATLDPYGMGIEMEGGKPGWNDAMNGLPALFGSSLGETAELKRVVKFILELSEKFDEAVFLPEEVSEFLISVDEILKTESSITDFKYWDSANDAKEAYRDKIRFGISGKENKFTTQDIYAIFIKILKRIDRGLSKALKYGNGIYPTYFTYEAVKYEQLRVKEENGETQERVKVLEFECSSVPYFLESPARILKTTEDKEQARKLYKAVKNSDIYDRKLKMYKTSVSLENLPNEIGRLRAFTPGWLERESIFLHMEYKYLLAMLKAGLYDEFYKDIETALVPFMSPAVYGRSILENSSFIASSVNPDEDVHGRGFVARLSGSTAEFISMWYMIFAGERVFYCENGELKLQFKPKIKADFFDEKDEVSFTFLGHTEIIYHNPKRLDTFGSNAAKIKNIKIINDKGEVVQIDDRVIGEPYSQNIRNGKVKSIEILIS
ncbi:cellobiose phosphorylase [Clostridium oryzae]|uniref:Cellobiose phosphorylase n=1 Tax=Clostridium oryzae TaxID=1450648 RepID=A0A1V4IZ13_9CLOT|nr:cellobiose phosphorylase [Clostridium oryzae]OPJ65014.1 hypothetical protein CLORY_00140 [Clostridium oryzae]